LRKGARDKIAEQFCAEATKQRMLADAIAAALVEGRNGDVR
jgi:hypothetical protein